MGAAEDAAAQAAKTRFVASASGEVKDLLHPVLGRGARILWGTGIGAGAGVASGVIQGQWRDPWKLAADAAIGAGAGAAGGFLGVGSSTTANVLVGAGSAAVAGVGYQIVSNGGVRGLNPVPVGIDAVIGAVVPGAGAAVGAAGVGNVADTIGTDVLGGIGTVVCAFSGGSC